MRELLARMLYRLEGWRDPERVAAVAFWIALLALLGVIEVSAFRVPALAVPSWREPPANGGAPVSIS